MHWACAKISAASDVPDEQLRDTVVARLSGHPAVRFATVAAHAQAIGRRGLAALLLEYESCAAEQASARFCRPDASLCCRSQQSSATVSGVMSLANFGHLRPSLDAGPFHMAC